MEKNKKIIYLIIAVVVLLVIAVFAYMAMNKNDNKVDKNQSNTSIDDFEVSPPMLEFDENDIVTEVEVSGNYVGTETEIN